MVVIVFTADITPEFMDIFHDKFDVQQAGKGYFFTCL
jgi:hypothetical protein